jgi:hypothetical protein
MQAKIPEPLTMDMNHPANLTMPTPPPTAPDTPGGPGGSDSTDGAAPSDEQSPATNADDRIYSQILDKLRRDDADKKTG